MIYGVGDLSKGKTRIDRMPDRAEPCNAIFQLEVPIRVPSERSYAITRPNVSTAQRVSQLSSAPRRIAVRITMNWAIRPARYDLGTRMKPFRMLDER
jgi:hypothetical protein